MRSLCRLPVAQNHNFGQILTFWGLLYRPPFTDEGQIWCAIADHRTAFSVVANWHQSDKAEHGCTTTKLQLSNGIKIGSPSPLLQRLHGEIGRTISEVQKRDEQTDKQTKSSTFLAAPAAGEIRAPPNLAW